MILFRKNENAYTPVIANMNSTTSSSGIPAITEILSVQFSGSGKIFTAVKADVAGIIRSRRW